jgi:hypothetical protein
LLPRVDSRLEAAVGLRKAWIEMLRKETRVCAEVVGKEERMAVAAVAVEDAEDVEEGWEGLAGARAGMAQVPVSKT